MGTKVFLTSWLNYRLLAGITHKSLDHDAWVLFFQPISKRLLLADAQRRQHRGERTGIGLWIRCAA